MARLSRLKNLVRRQRPRPAATAPPAPVEEPVVDDPAPVLVDHGALDPNGPDVATYYDEWTDYYVSSFGDVFQTYRSQDPNELLLELGRNAGLAEGQRVLDAGCGIGGPAMLYAREFGCSIDGVTVSAGQVAEGRKRVEDAGLSDQVNIAECDFHHLDDHFEPDTFDVVYFFEALVHTPRVDVVLAAVAKVLKPGGTLYIKDLYRALPKEPGDNAKIDTAIKNTNAGFHLYVKPREEVVAAITAAGFEVTLERVLPLDDDLDYDTGNLFVLFHDIDIYEGQPVEYLSHAEIRATLPS